jgi:hypothetical protein
MNDVKLLKILILVYILAVCLDITYTYKKCIYKNGYKILPAILLHRLITIFMYFGWLFNNKIVLAVYILMLLTIIIHWFTNDWKCLITQYENYICDYPLNRKYDIFGNKVLKGDQLSHIIILCILISISIIKFS